MAEWIALEPTEMDLVAEEEGLRRFASPNDGPEQVRTRFDEGQGRFVVEFAYPGLEHPGDQVAYGPFRFVLGAVSQRLHRVEIDADRLKESVRALDLDAFEALLDSLKWLSGRKPDPQNPHPPRTANYTVALRAVERHRDELLRTLLL